MYMYKASSNALPHCPLVVVTLSSVLQFTKLFNSCCDQFSKSLVVLVVNLSSVSEVARCHQFLKYSSLFGVVLQFPQSRSLFSLSSVFEVARCSRCHQFLKSLVVIRQFSKSLVVLVCHQSPLSSVSEVARCSRLSSVSEVARCHQFPSRSLSSVSELLVVLSLVVIISF